MRLWPIIGQCKGSSNVIRDTGMETAACVDGGEAAEADAVKAGIRDQGPEMRKQGARERGNKRPTAGLENHRRDLS
jgi:hypothetical protein